MLTARESFLLFGKEKASGAYRYRLYFVQLETLNAESPRIHRLVAKTAKAFEAFKLGGLYMLTYSGVTIQAYDYDGEAELSESEYARLMELKDMTFMEPETAAKLHLNEAYAFHDRYYTFSETRQILEYAPGLRLRAAVRALNIALHVLALLVPFALYFWMLWGVFRAVHLAGFAAALIPLLAVGALPFVIYLMTLFYALTELLLLNLDFSKWLMLKKYTLQWGGMRKSLAIEPADKARLIKYGVITGAVFAVVGVLVVVVAGIG